MGYHVIDPGDIEPTPDRPCVQRRISDVADFSTVAVHVYEAEPGEQIPLAYHYHDEQEEAFYVVSGTLHVETPEADFTVEAGEVFAVEPGNAHRAHNPDSADERVEVLAVGAPTGIDDAHAYEP